METVKNTTTPKKDNTDIFFYLLIGLMALSVIMVIVYFVSSLLE